MFPINVEILLIFASYSKICVAVHNVDYTGNRWNDIEIIWDFKSSL